MASVDRANPDGGGHNLDAAQTEGDKTQLLSERRGRFLKLGLSCCKIPRTRAAKAPPRGENWRDVVATMESRRRA